MAQQGYPPEKAQEAKRRVSQEMSGASEAAAGAAGQGEPTEWTRAQAAAEEAIKSSAGAGAAAGSATYSPRHAAGADTKNPFSPHYYRSARPHGHFEMGPRGLDCSPHRMGVDFSNRLRDYGPQRSSSIHGHEFADGPMKPEYLGHRTHFGSQVAPGGMGHGDVVLRHQPDYYAALGYAHPRAARFSSQEYLDAPALYGRWPDYRAEYRQRRRSQQDLHCLDHNADSGNTTKHYFPILPLFHFTLISFCIFILET